MWRVGAASGSVAPDGQFGGVLTRTVVTRWRLAQVDYAERIAVRVAKDDEVRLRRIQPPVELGCSESDEPFNFGLLLGSGIHEQVKVDTRVSLHWRLTAL